MADSSSHFRTIEQADLPLTGGTLKYVTVKSTALKGRGDVSLYIPGQVRPNSSIPVVILLHGVYCSHWAWAQLGKAHLSLQDMIVSGEIPPMILAMPSDGLWGDGSGYFAHSGRDFESWIVDDVPRLVSDLTGNDPASPHYIAGLSMGGFGALCLGARHPGKFRAFSGHSSAVSVSDLIPHVEESWEDFGLEPGNGPSVLGEILANRQRLVPFRFDCGTGDFLIDSNRELARSLEAENIRFIYEEYPGAHEWDYWQQHIRKSYRFFAANL